MVCLPARRYKFLRLYSDSLSGGQDKYLECYWRQKKTKSSEFFGAFIYKCFE